MIIATVYPGKIEEFLDFFRKICSDDEQIASLKNMLLALKTDQVAFLNIYGIDDKKQLRDLKEQIQYKEDPQESFIYRVKGSKRSKNYITVHINVPGLDAGPSYRNWWEHEDMLKK